MTKPSQTVRMTIENLDNEFKSLMETNVIDCGIYINQRIVTKFEIKGQMDDPRQRPSLVLQIDTKDVIRLAFQNTTDKAFSIRPLTIKCEDIIGQGIETEIPIQKWHRIQVDSDEHAYHDYFMVNISFVIIQDAKKLEQVQQNDILYLALDKNQFQIELNQKQIQQIIRDLQKKLDQTKFVSRNNSDLKYQVENMNIDFNKIVELGTKLKLEKNQHYKEEFITKQNIILQKLDLFFKNVSVYNWQKAPQDNYLDQQQKNLFTIGQFSKSPVRTQIQTTEHLELMPYFQMDEKQVIATPQFKNYENLTKQQLLIIIRQKEKDMQSLQQENKLFQDEIKLISNMTNQILKSINSKQSTNQVRQFSKNFENFYTVEAKQIKHQLIQIHHYYKQLAEKKPSNPLYTGISVEYMAKTDLQRSKSQNLQTSDDKKTPSNKIAADKEIIHFFNTHEFKTLDLAMKQFTKEFECGKLLVKESDHHYKLGPNRLLMKLQNGKIMVRTGSSYEPFLQFYLKHLQDFEVRPRKTIVDELNDKKYLIDKFNKTDEIIIKPKRPVSSNVRQN